jgi:hypothetical protein
LVERAVKAASFGRLVECHPRLGFDILSIGIGEQIFPDGTLPGPGPNPQFFARRVRIGSPVSKAEVAVMPIAAKPTGVGTHNVVGLVASGFVVPVIGEIHAFLINGPGICKPVVSDVVGTREEKLHVIAGLKSGVLPGKVSVVQWRRIIPQALCFEVCFVLRKYDFDPPLGARGQVKASYDTGYTAIGVIQHHIVHRSGCPGCMAQIQAEVVFDAAAGPGTPDTDGPEFHDVVMVDKILPG